MTGNSGFDRRIFDFLDREVGRGSPDYLDDVLRRTVATRQRPAWSSIERWLPVDLTSRASTLAPPQLGRALLIVLLVMGLVGAVVVVGTRQQQLPAPFGLAANGVILYSADGDIHVADPDGGNPRVLIGGPEDDVAPLLSYDGTRFVFVRTASTFGYDVLVADADGSDIRALTPRPIVDPTWMDWSPDGTRLLVLHAVGLSEPTVSILATEGGPEMTELPLGDIVPDSPSWRPPDGREILFRGASGDRTALYAIGAEGLGLHAVTPIVPDEGAYRGPRLSPDGSRVTYERCLPAAAPGGRCEVHVLDLAANVDVRVGFDPTARHELQPKFSPDGGSVLFVRFVPEQDAALVIATADGHDMGRQIGPSLGWANAMFEFSPDGRKIVISFEDGRRLQVIDVATGAIETGEYAEYPSWQRRAP